MDASTVVPVIVMVLGSLLPALAGWLRGATRRAARRARRLEERVEAWEEWAVDSRRDRRLHNDRWHPDGTGAIPLPELPRYMTEDDEEGS